jgi:hypothetical protein
MLIQSAEVLSVSFDPILVRVPLRPIIHRVMAPVKDTVAVVLRAWLYAPMRSSEMELAREAAVIARVSE